MPSLFVSHGAPTFALEPGLAGSQLHALGQRLGRPRAIVVISPHWMTEAVEISSGPAPKTIHDFYGFPRELYDLEYRAPGDPGLALEIQHALLRSGIEANLDPARGLDHGAWVPLRYLYPNADIPVLQVSLPYHANEHFSLDLGRALSPLAGTGVLVIGSGSLTHNLYEFRFGPPNETAADYAREFALWIRRAIQAGDVERLLKAMTIAPYARRAHPTLEHFLPLLVAVGAASTTSPVTVLDGGFRYGMLSMESYLIGSDTHLTSAAS